MITVAHKRENACPFDVNIQISSGKIKLSLEGVEEVKAFSVDVDGKTANTQPNESKTEKRVIKGPSLEINLDDLKKANLWSDRVRIAYYIQDGNFLNLMGPIVPEIETLNSKQPVSAYFNSTGKQNVLVIFVPSTEANFTDCGFVVQVNSKNKITSNYKFSEMDPKNVAAKIFPELQLKAQSTLKADEMTTASFKIVSSEGNLYKKSMVVYLDSVEGYLPKKRVEVKNGEASFKVSALGLEAGDSLRIKLGFRYVTGLVEHTFKII